MTVVVVSYADQALLIILSVFLAMFLILSIIVLIYILQILSEVKKLIKKAEDFARETGDSIEAVINNSPVLSIAKFLVSMRSNKDSSSHNKKEK